MDLLKWFVVFRFCGWDLGQTLSGLVFGILGVLYGGLTITPKPPLISVSIGLGGGGVPSKGKSMGPGVRGIIVDLGKTGNRSDQYMIVAMYSLYSFAFFAPFLSKIL